MAAIAFLTETCKADPEFKYFLGAAGGFSIATIGALIGSSNLKMDTWNNTEQEITPPSHITPIPFITGSLGASLFKELSGRSPLNTDPEQHKKDVHDAFSAFDFIKSGGNFSAISGLTFGAFCMLVILLKNLDGVAAIVAGAAEAVPF